METFSRAAISISLDKHSYFGSIWVLCVFNWTRSFRIIEYFKLDETHKDHQAQLHQASAGETIVLEPLENTQENCF